MDYADKELERDIKKIKKFIKKNPDPENQKVIEIM